MRGDAAAGRLLRAVFEDGVMSRAEATAVAGISRSAAGTAVDVLARLGLLAFDDPRVDGPGRPSQVLSVSERGAAVVACELGPEETAIVTQNLGGSLGQTERVSIDIRSQAPEKAILQVVRAIRKRIDEMEERCVGVGVAIPGMVNRRTGVATLVHPLGWRNVPVLQFFRTYLEGPYVTVGQDALLAALAEFHFGAGAGADRMLLLISGVFGLGGAVVSGANGPRPADHSLQAGHIIVQPDGLECSCGARGCLEVYADGRGFGAALGLDRPATAAEVVAAVDSGLDTTQLENLRKQVLTPFTTGLVSLVNALGPDRVVLAGHLAALSTVEGFSLKEALAESVVASAEDVGIFSAQFGNGVLRGAALDAFEALLRDPQSVLSMTRLPAARRE